MDIPSLDLKNVKKIIIMPNFKSKYSLHMGLIALYVVYYFYKTDDPDNVFWIDCLVASGGIFLIFYSFLINHGLLIEKNNITLIQSFPHYVKKTIVYPTTENFIFTFNNLRNSDAEGENIVGSFSVIFKKRVYEFHFMTSTIELCLKDDNSYLNCNIDFSHPDHNKHVFSFIRLHYPKLKFTECKKNLGIWYKGELDDVQK